MEKTCVKCLVNKDIKEFYKNKKKKGGYQNECKVCNNQYLKEYNLKNPNKRKEINDRYVKNNPEKVKESCKSWYDRNPDYQNTWYENNKEKKSETGKIWYYLNKDHKLLTTKEWTINNKESVNEYRRNWSKNRKKIDSLFRLSENVRSSIRKSITEKKFRKTNKTIEILGCSFDELRIYIDSKFESWMNWENYGKYNGELNYGWDIDHIIPTSSAITEDEILKLNHYTNLQPLCSKINRDIKRNNICQN